MAKNTNSLKPSSNGKMKKRFSDLLRNYWRMYCEKSTVHCVRYLYDPNLHNIERLIWFVLLVTCSVVTIFFYLQLAEQYTAQKLETIIEDPQYPVFYLSFPAVGVCTDNRMNWQKMEEAKSLFLPSNASEEIIELFTTLVKRMETMRFGNFHYSFKDMEDQYLESLNFVNITTLAFHFSLKCEDIFQPNSCIWRNTPFNCCDYFILETTEHGYCLIFNSELTARSIAIQEREGKAYYPRHNSQSGQGTGLLFSLLMNDSLWRKNSSATDIVYIMIKKPDEISNDVFAISPNAETFITVRAQITNTDESTRRLLPEKRKCVFSNEQSYSYFNTFSKAFMGTNCLNNCHKAYMAQLCNCTMPIFFMNDTTIPDCRPSDLRCLAKNNDIFTYDKRHEEDTFLSESKPGMTCYCLVNCNQVEYNSVTTTLPLIDEALEKLNSSKFYKVDVHYQAELSIKFRTGLEFTTMDLIANFGGIFGLCLGASMVSAVELLYHSTIGFIWFLYDNQFYDEVFSNAIKRKWRQWLHYKNSNAVDLDATAVSSMPHLKTPQFKFSKIQYPLKENAWQNQSSFEVPKGKDLYTSTQSYKP